MKIIIKKKVKLAIKKSGGGYGDSRQDFLKLEPIDLAGLNHLVIPKRQRPYLSLTAKKEGLKYTTFQHPEDEDMAIVIRFE